MKIFLSSPPNTKLEIKMKGNRQKLLDLMNEFDKVVGYRIDTHKSVAFLYTSTNYQNEKLTKPSHLLLQQQSKGT